MDSLPRTIFAPIQCLEPPASTWEIQEGKKIVQQSLFFILKYSGVKEQIFHLPKQLCWPYTLIALHTTDPFTTFELQNPSQEREKFADIVILRL